MASEGVRGFESPSFLQQLELEVAARMVAASSSFIFWLIGVYCPHASLPCAPSTGILRVRSFCPQPRLDDWDFGSYPCHLLPLSPWRESPSRTSCTSPISGVPSALLAMPACSECRSAPLRRNLFSGADRHELHALDDRVSFQGTIMSLPHKSVPI